MKHYGKKAIRNKGITHEFTIHEMHKLSVGKARVVWHHLARQTFCLTGQ